MEPFTGEERYSLVFFTTGSYAKAKRDQLDFLASLGAAIPTPVMLNYFISYLSPAKGYDMSGKTKSSV